MTEDFLHYIWRYGLYRHESLRTDSGLAVQVLRAGDYNGDSGPDFLNARIRIGSALWVGHVEIHLLASDWFVHQHHEDRAYDQVILHVVKKNDRQAVTSNGLSLPTLSLLFPDKYFENYQKMVQALVPIPCGTNWKNLPVIQVENAISAMGVERMEERYKWLSKKLKDCKGGWRDLYLQVFFRAFGFGKNQENFDMLAQSIPAFLIDKHRHNLFQLESLLFGQAGLIPENDKSPYVLALKNEYRFLKNKHHLEKPQEIHWKHMRTRPINQPVSRLAQLAAWLHHSGDFFQVLLDSGFSPEKFPKESYVSTYWKHHHDFGGAGEDPVPGMGVVAHQLLYINALFPLNAFYQQRHEIQQSITRWMEALELLDPERNQIIDKWKEAGFRVPNAFYSQAFIHIYKSYCLARKCLHCRLGQLILQK